MLDFLVGNDALSAIVALRLFVSETGKMIPRRISGNCARHQRPLAIAIKRARQLALLPYTGQGI